jgi:hypothetical protein
MTQNNDTQHIVTQHNDTQHNDTRNDTQHKDAHKTTFTITTLNIKGLFATLGIMTHGIDDTQNNNTATMLSVIRQSGAFYLLLC